MNSPQIPPPPSPPAVTSGDAFPAGGFQGGGVDSPGPVEAPGRSVADVLVVVAEKRRPAQAPVIPEGGGFLELPEEAESANDDRFSLGKLAATLVGAAAVSAPRPKTMPVPAPQVLSDDSLDRLMERFSPGRAAANPEADGGENPLDLLEVESPPEVPRPEPVLPFERKSPVSIPALSQPPKLTPAPPSKAPLRPLSAPVLPSMVLPRFERAEKPLDLLEPIKPLAAAVRPATIEQAGPADGVLEKPGTARDSGPAMDERGILAGLADAAPAREEIRKPAERGTGLVIAGLLLVLPGILLACLMPLRWLELDSVVSADDAAGRWAAACHRAALVFLGAGAAGLLALGVGSLSLRRWAPPVIHALGWVSALTALFLLAEGTAAAFYLSGEDGAPPSVLTSALLPVGLAGLVAPLLFIAFFQRPSVAEICEAADRRERWTDRLQVPGVMVFLTGVLLTIAALAMLQHAGAFPWFGRVLTGREGQAGWLAAGGLSLAAALACVFRSRAGWWLLAVVVLFLLVSFTVTGTAAGWSSFFAALGHPHPPDFSTAGPLQLWTGLAFLPLVVILLMSRRAISSPHAS